MKISPDWFRFCYLRLLLLVVVWLSWPFRLLDNPKISVRRSSSFGCNEASIRRTYGEI
uniref:Uncharacterized protein n=1 Tax=Helianthus annuus TaxID=4232 RepID=A0A251RXK4_HELAN